ncbi:two-component system, OmpR family, sensor histidine kinase KdpD [Paenibacillaceae bacterium GAS479]|nr:two-component system, OmpR family, sensor histidine kinase KdpD [Paenibacillaceae bacterium GAS479]
MTTKEKIMVCVYYGPHGERLIRRGVELAARLNCPLHVLSVIPVSMEELSQKQEAYLNLWRIRCAESGALFFVEHASSRPAVAVIAEIARKRQITGIIVGQSAQSRWQELIRGSFTNELLRRVGKIDLHIVAVQRMDNDLEETHERGIHVTVRRAGAEYELSHSLPDNGTVAMGIFFKNLNTEFDSGLLKLKNGDGFAYFKIRKGVVADAAFPPFLEKSKKK